MATWPKRTRMSVRCAGKSRAPGCFIFGELGTAVHGVWHEHFGFSILWLGEDHCKQYGLHGNEAMSTRRMVGGHSLHGFGLQHVPGMEECNLAAEHFCVEQHLPHFPCLLVHGVDDHIVAMDLNTRGQSYRTGHMGFCWCVAQELWSSTPWM